MAQEPATTPSASGAETDGTINQSINQSIDKIGEHKAVLEDALVKAINLQQPTSGPKITRKDLHVANSEIVPILKNAGQFAWLALLGALQLHMNYGTLQSCRDNTSLGAVLDELHFKTVQDKIRDTRAEIEQFRSFAYSDQLTENLNTIENSFKAIHEIAQAAREKRQRAGIGG